MYFAGTTGQVSDCSILHQVYVCTDLTTERRAEERRGEERRGE
jgi:hypothetical protein